MFNNFFLDKVKKVTSGLNNIQQEYADIPPVPLHAQCVPHHGRLEELSPAIEEEVQKIFNRSPAKSCCLNPLPSSVLSQVIECVLPFLTRIVNTPVATRSVPSSMKLAAVTPLLKKVSLDHQQLKKYRPVSNISSVSKLCERVVVQRLNDHLEYHGLQ